MQLAARVRMVMRITIRTDFHRATRMLTDIQRRQLPFANTLALTKLAQQARDDLHRELPSAFDSPTRFTLNSIAVQPATKARQESAIFFKDFAPKGVPAGRYLRAQIEGGPRTDKASERQLRTAGHLPGGYYLVPAKGAKLNGHGNINPGQVVQMLTGLGALSTARRGGNRRRNAATQGYFVVQPGAPSGLPPGVYRRTPQGGHVMIFIMTRQPTYQKRFDFDGLAKSSYQRNAPRAIKEALEHAFRTARR